MPLFKKAEKSLISNYRPISLLSAVGKVFERIVFKEVFNHLISNNLLYKFQSGVYKYTLFPTGNIAFKPFK
jgi:hypothetical protein